MQTTHSPEMIMTQWWCYLVSNVISDNYIPVFHASLPFSVNSMPRKYRSCYNWRQKISPLSMLVKSSWQKSIKAKDWVGVLVSSGFIIGQDVATLHSSRESNQLRSSNDREYMEEKAEQGDLIICTINYCVPEIFWDPANLSSQSGASCLSWLFLDHDLGVQPDHSVSTNVLFRVRWVTICVRECGVARGVDHYIGPMSL